MRILFAIPHYFAWTGAGNYASERSAPELRARVVRQCIGGLHQTFSDAQSLLNGRTRQLHAANPQLSAEVTIALCTTGDSHLVSQLGIELFDHIRTHAEPRHLGFECHKVLRNGLGQYDYFGYLEDDLRITDGLFFRKLNWFTSQFGEGALLQPNRFEAIDEPLPYKLYIDGNMHQGPVVERDEPHRRVEVPAFGQGVVFQRVGNVHSGCFFLNPAQLARWAAQADFAVPSAAFGGPLESAATLGIMQHFRVYKPARENAAFLELEHLDRRYLGRHFWPTGGSPTRLDWT